MILAHEVLRNIVPALKSMVWKGRHIHEYEILIEARVEISTR